MIEKKEKINERLKKDEGSKKDDGLKKDKDGNVIGTEPSMALLLGPIVFVVVVTGGLGSIKGALVASIIIGLMQTAAVSLEFNLNNVFHENFCLLFICSINLYFS